ncbi:hypothetical protein KC317_g7323, partial [Hortaea werneckii]
MGTAPVYFRSPNDGWMWATVPDGPNGGSDGAPVVQMCISHKLLITLAYKTILSLKAFTRQHMSLPDRTMNGSKGAQASPPPQGIYVPVPTFFAGEGTASYDPVTPPLDTKTQSEHSLFLVRGGIKGLVILGSSGEAIFLRNKERNELISSQRKTLDENGYKDRPIIAGTATQQIDDTVEMIKESKDAGAEYAMVLGPGYFAPSTSQQGIQK